MTDEITVTFTHKGWMGIVPIILGDPDGICCLDVRYDWLNWALDLQVALHQGFTALGMFLFPYWEPAGFAIMITGRLNPPISKRADRY